MSRRASKNLDDVDSIFLDIKVEAMSCFTDPLTTIYLRDVTETVNTINLRRRN